MVVSPLYAVFRILNEFIEIYQSLEYNDAVTSEAERLMQRTSSCWWQTSSCRLWNADIDLVLGGIHFHVRLNGFPWLHTTNLLPSIICYHKTFPHFRPPQSRKTQKQTKAQRTGQVCFDRQIYAQALHRQCMNLEECPQFDRNMPRCRLIAKLTSNLLTVRLSRIVTIGEQSPASAGPSVHSEAMEQSPGSVHITFIFIHLIRSVTLQGSGIKTQTMQLQAGQLCRKLRLQLLSRKHTIHTTYTESHKNIATSALLATVFRRKLTTHLFWQSYPDVIYS